MTQQEEGKLPSISLEDAKAAAEAVPPRSEQVFASDTLAKFGKGKPIPYAELSDATLEVLRTGKGAIVNRRKTIIE